MGERGLWRIGQAPDGVRSPITAGACHALGGPNRLSRGRSHWVASLPCSFCETLESTDLCGGRLVGTANPSSREADGDRGRQEPRPSRVLFSVLSSSLEIPGTVSDGALESCAVVN
jgi:hypothetical protein